MSKFLEAVKKARTRVIGSTDVQFERFVTYEDNIFGNKMRADYIEMFNRGDGEELKSKACAAHSSSMLAYNFFHWISADNMFEYEDTVYNRVFFEVRIPTISKSPAPANMDIVLVSENKKKWLMLESKFTEYFHKSFREMINLSHGYFIPHRYLFADQDEAIRTCNLVEYWNRKVDPHGEEFKSGYYDGIKQQLCHLIAIKNIMLPSGMAQVEAKVKKYNPGLERMPEYIDFKTILFDPPKVEVFKKEYDAYADYEKLCEDFCVSVVEKGACPKTVTVGVTTYSEVWAKMKSQIHNIELCRFLADRYMSLTDKV
ncbi:MAG: hypothetical protein IJR99_16325 [Kiritimatiellae bacterium]|nr:hypothetical protein [Kiritimatiellia bacterium]